MLTIIWILKGILFLLFTFTGFNKILLPKDKLLNKGMKGLINLEAKQIKAAGVLEVLGALGLILPSLLNIYPILSAVFRPMPGIDNDSCRLDKLQIETFRYFKHCYFSNLHFHCLL